MAKIIVIADDITGSLDTAVMLAKKYINAQVVKYDSFEAESIEEELQALVVNTDSRHIKPEEAYKRVGAVCEAVCRIPNVMFYKKTDSALRGNIGIEFAAMLDSLKEKKHIFYFPAFPKMNRTTIGGLQYIDGIPVSESIFGEDILNPVRTSNIVEIIRETSQIKCRMVKNIEEIFALYKDIRGVFIFDARSQSELENFANYIKNMDETPILSGCSGFAEFLPECAGLLKMRGKGVRKNLFSKHLIVSASLNDISRSQMKYAKNAGYEYEMLRLDEQDYYSDRISEKIYLKLKDSGVVLVEGQREKSYLTPEEICKRMAMIVDSVLRKNCDTTITVIGGDTLDAVLKILGCQKVIPLEEVELGVVASEIICRNKKVFLVSKSGGFGTEETVVNIITYLKTTYGKMCSHMEP